MPGRLEGKIALVTGGANGIGEACVRRFIAEGARVAIGDLNEMKGNALQREFPESSRFIPLDVSQKSSFKHTLQITVESWGCLDILVNNAGFVFPSKPVQTTTDEELDLVIDINLKGTFYGCQLAYPYLKASKGCVLNISSMAGITGQADHAAYSATKGAINALTKSTAADWGPEGIRINALCPAGVWTESLRMWSQTVENPSGIEQYLNRIHALGYCPEPEEIASVAAFLCSDDAKFVTGCLMPVSGGGECGYKL